ncbi:hypothetical protein SAMN02910417_01950 [Eubacterium oxidoreducens]|uniref:Uncharacterized protein n=1 Tax=Eubacterium oxidoreducens TaxID=1732 RepID=A0A1G6C0T4_EUBOX|nr:hypothetical protein SAMN02910417_01950 [Eubacterium oxidoreducens]
MAFIFLTKILKRTKFFIKFYKEFNFDCIKTIQFRLFLESSCVLF